MSRSECIAFVPRRSSTSGDRWTSRFVLSGRWLAGLLAFAAAAHAGDPPYPREISRWQAAAPPPPQSDRAALEAWFLAANYSDLHWRVFREQGAVLAEPGESMPVRGPRPDFQPEAGGFSGGRAFARVEDGWLVGFNNGEFGAALYWFSGDGRRSQKISDHQVVEFFSLPDGIHAIEGLAHLGMSEGSVIRVEHSGPGSPWHAETVTKLPFAPDAVSVRRDGAILITLSESLVSLEKDLELTTLHAQPLWSGLYASSSVLTDDESRLYIGMRQYVVEYELETGKVRYLVPSN
jgi:hypothetical protein